MDKQIEELDNLIRKHIERPYVFKPVFNKNGEKEGYTAVYTSHIAEDIYNAGYRKDEEKFREKAKFYYKKCKSYGIENFYDTELEYVDD